MSDAVRVPLSAAPVPAASRPQSSMPAETATTPTGLQTTAELWRRRRLVLVLNVVTWLS